MRRASFVDVQQEEIASRMDRLACDVAARAKLFESLEAKSQNHVEKAATLAETDDGWHSSPKARCRDRAREIILAYLATPGFLTGYFAGQTRPGQ